MHELPSDNEARLQLAIQFVRKKKGKEVLQACKLFGVNRGQLRSRLAGHPTKNAIRGLHHRALNPAQDEAIRRYIRTLDDKDCAPRYSMIERAALSMINAAQPPEKRLKRMGQHWLKRWIKRQPGLFKIRRQPLSVARRNAHNPEIIQHHFDLFRKQRDEYSILPEDTWNMDETGYRIGISKADWAVVTNPTKRVFSSSPENRESATSIEAINATGLAIPPIIILQGINILMRWFSNDLHPETQITTSESGSTDDWISYQWIKHFDEYTRKVQVGKKRHLIMDGCINHMTREFLEYAEQHDIILCPLPPHTSHILQPLDVVVFQPLKHHHAEAVFGAASTGDEAFKKQEFLFAFQGFHDKAFTKHNIIKSFAETGHIPYQPEKVYKKIGVPPPSWQTSADGIDADLIDSYNLPCHMTSEDEREDQRLWNELHTSTPSRYDVGIASPTLHPQRGDLRTPSPPAPAQSSSVNHTPDGPKEVNKVAFQLLTMPELPDDFRRKLSQFTKSAIATANHAKLLSDYLDHTDAAQKARAKRAEERAYVAQTGGIIKASKARTMTMERFELEAAREDQRVEKQQQRLNKEWLQEEKKQEREAKQAERLVKMQEEEKEKANKKRAREEAKKERTGTQKKRQQEYEKGVKEAPK